MKTFTICEKTEDSVVDSRKISRDSSNSQETQDQSQNNTPTETIRGASIIIANKSYANSLLNIKAMKTKKEDKLIENCQNNIFCGVFKLFGKSKKNKPESNESVKS